MEPAPSIALAPSGMSCAHCVRAVREALESVEGLRVHDVAVGRATVTVTDPRTGWTELEPFVRAALEQAGYGLP